MKQMLALLAATTLVGFATAPAFAKPHAHAQKAGAKPTAAKTAMACCKPGSSPKEGCRCGSKTDTQVPGAAVRKLPLNLASGMRFDASSRSPQALATVYADRAGALTGVKIASRGLPDPDRLMGYGSHYVVWLVDTETQAVHKLGALESRNSGDAVFGYSTETPLTGFDRLMITSEPNAATKTPNGAQRLTADLPETCQAGCCADH